MPNEQIEMIERVARAIFGAHNAVYTFGGPARWESDPEHWRRYARAAIEALTPHPDTGQGEQGNGVPASPSGCQPTASAAEEASSQSGIPNAKE